MLNFINLKKRDLKNAQHFAFIQAFITAMNDAHFTAARIAAKLQELVTAFAIEDRFYMIFRASELVAQRTEADNRRDNFYARLHRLVQAWAGSGMPLLDPAATVILRIFNLYKVKVSAQLEEETGQMENLKTDLSTPEMQAHLQTINGTWLFQQMCAAHEQVKSIRLQEGAEVSEKELGALANARKQCDTLYDELTATIEGASLFADNPAPYEQFIKTWNGTLKIYQDMLERKSGSGSSGSSGNSGSTGSTGDSGDSGSTGDSGTDTPGTDQGGVGTIETGDGGTTPGTNTGTDTGDTGGTGTIDTGDTGDTGGDNGGGTTPDPNDPPVQDE